MTAKSVWLSKLTTYASTTAMDTQSQVHYGPYSLSFGDFLKQICRARKTLNLKSDEYVILLCLVNTMPRPKYINAIEAIVNRPAEFWVEETGLLKTNVFRALRGLVAKNVLSSLGETGQKHTYFLHPEFSNKVASLKFDVHNPVCKPVGKSKKCDQSDHSSVINQITGCDQSDHSSVINQISDCDPVDHSALYIEDSLFFPKDSLPFPSSIPAVDNVDNFSVQERHLALFFNEDQLARSRMFISKLKETQLQRLDGFLQFLDQSGWAMDVKGMNLMWARWFYNELPGTMSHQYSQTS